MSSINIRIADGIIIWENVGINVRPFFYPLSMLPAFNILQNNFSVAGQLVMHAHFHLLPRRKDDGKNI